MPKKSMASVFKNSFLSLAGQKERFTNVVNYLATATGTQKLLGTAKTDPSYKQSTVEKVITSPAFVYGAPLVIAGGVVAAPVIAGHAAIAGTGAAIAGGTGIVLGSTALKVGAGAVGGALVASMLGDKGSSSSPVQTVTPSQDPQQITTTNSYTNFLSANKQYTITTSTIYGDYGSIGGVSPSMSTNPYLNTEQRAYPSLDQQQQVNPEQTSTASSGGMNWLMIALIVGGAYFLLNK